MGFEPTVGFPTLDFESSALNRTQPPFLSFGIVGLNLRRAIITRTPEFAKAKHHASFQIAMIIILRRIYSSYLDAAIRYQLPIQRETPTRRD